VHARPMRLLVLGGTRFVGRAVIAEAIKRGWNVTALHRGVTGGMPPDVTVLYADRADNAALASSLGTGTWDIVVDTWSGAPRGATAAAELLAERAETATYRADRYTSGAPTSTKPPRSSKAARPARPATIPRSSAEPSLEY
jgi:nucleoside-diphosphate-sugar epimerase